jgi:anti-sigma factor RsiW
MGCDRVLEWMMQELDGDLGSAQRVELEAHLAGCVRCQAEWGRLQELERLLKGVPTVRPSVGFMGRVLARVDRRRRFRQVALGGLALAAGAAAATFLSIAPAVWTLPGMSGDLLTLWRGESLAVTRLMGAAATLLDSLRLTTGALVLPAAPLLLCCVVLALMMGLLWLRLIQRLQPAWATVARR